jgi:hypothetical protein
MIYLHVDDLSRGVGAYVKFEASKVQRNERRSSKSPFDAA